jgi:hypothetical protein
MQQQLKQQQPHYPAAVQRQQLKQQLPQQPQQQQQLQHSLWET